MIDENTPNKSKQIKWLILAIIYFVVAAIGLVPFLENYSYSHSWTYNLIFNGGVMPTVAGLLGAFSIFQYSSRLKEPNDRPIELNSKPAISQAYRREKIKICRRVALISVFVLVVGSVSAYLSLNTKALNPPGGITIGFVLFLFSCGSVGVSAICIIASICYMGYYSIAAKPTPTTQPPLLVAFIAGNILLILLLFFWCIGVSTIVSVPNHPLGS